MNKAILSGRWVRDPDIRYSAEGKAVAKGTIAVDCRYKKDGDQTADFISVVAFGKTAEIIEKYFFKGMKCMVTGRIQTGSYENKEGNKVYTTDVVIEEIEFAEVKGSNKKDDSDGFTESNGEGEEVFNF